jgi:hypothetical protein
LESAARREKARRGPRLRKRKDGTRPLGSRLGDFVWPIKLAMIKAFCVLRFRPPIVFMLFAKCQRFIYARR